VGFVVDNVTVWKGLLCTLGSPAIPLSQTAPHSFIFIYLFIYHSMNTYIILHNPTDTGSMTIK
jgi:hypothetical protein